MKKIVSFTLALSLLLASTACAGKDSSSDAPSSTVTAVSTDADITTDAPSDISANPLTCHMTERELKNVKCGELTVFSYEQPASPVPDKGVAIEVYTKQDCIDRWKNYNEKHPDLSEYGLTEESLNDIIASYESLDDDYIEFGQAFIDGEFSCTECPPVGYNGGELTIPLFEHRYMRSDDEGTKRYYQGDKEITREEYNGDYQPYGQKTYKDFEELKEHIHDDVVFSIKTLNNGSDKKVEEAYQRELKMWEAVINNSYTALKPGAAEEYSEWKYNPSGKAYWEIDHDSVMAIKDYVSEYSFYDEQLGSFFTVHVTTPPDYDPAKTYPAYVLTDGVWRFNNCPAMRKAMEEGKADDVILISIGFDYMTNGMDDTYRKEVFCQKCDKFLDFITDDLMPYLGNEYNIDFSRSTLYGHSLGGTFAHYAVFNSDKYENQPFHNYIIGSPAFWSPGFLPYVDQEEVLNDYYYFDRNQSLDKRIFVCAGADEDPVYEEYYGDNDSTLEGVAHLMERLEAYGVTDAVSKLYPGSGHYQFIPEMLVETLIKFYPAE